MHYRESRQVQAICVVILLGLLQTTQAKQYRSFKNDYLLKVNFNTKDAIMDIGSFSYEADNGTRYSPDLIHIFSLTKSALYFIPQEIYNQTLSFLDKHNFTYSTVKNDLDKKVKIERRINRKLFFKAKFLRISNSMTNYYMRFAEMEQWILNQGRRHGYVKVESIGKTAENRHIYLMKISKNPKLPIIWIDAGIHAREWISPATAIHTITKLLDNSKESQQLLDQYRIYVIPLLNPDGYEHSHTIDRLWRKNRVTTWKSNCKGVDINRNFPYRWGGRGSSNDSCALVYRGKAAKSEKETKAVVDQLVKLKGELLLYISLHSFGQYIMTPYGYSGFRYPRNYYKSMRLGNKVSFYLQKKYGRFYQVGSTANLLYEASGASDDFAAGEVNVPYTFTIELPDRGRYGFLLPPTYIKSVGNQFWESLTNFVEGMK